jgi:hypothetical protein
MLIYNFFALRTLVFFIAFSCFGGSVACDMILL